MFLRVCLLCLVVLTGGCIRGFVLNVSGRLQNNNGEAIERGNLKVFGDCGMTYPTGGLDNKGKFDPYRGAQNLTSDANGEFSFDAFHTEVGGGVLPMLFDIFSPMCVSFAVILPERDISGYMVKYVKGADKVTYQLMDTKSKKILPDVYKDENGGLKTKLEYVDTQYGRRPKLNIVITVPQQ
jgi:hypothetical protein